MENYGWLIWVLIGVSLIVAEIFTLGFVIFWWGLAALLAALAGFLGVGLAGQFAVFIIFSVLFTVLSRTILANVFRHDEKNALKTGVDALPGQIGTVTTASAGALNEGAVKVYGSVWTAFPVVGEEPLKEGEKVEVIEVKGSSIYVRRADAASQLPGWRDED